MNFSTIEFLFYFLPLFLLVYFLLPGKNIILLIFSLFFYIWGEGLFIVLLLVLGIFNWIAGILIGEYLQKYRRVALVIAILLNLVALFYFKYIVFVLTSINLITSKSLFPIPEVLLPIGISFFTFHAISYLVDVYKKNFPPEKNLLDFMLYIAMFPQLIAGPIIRYATVRAEIKSRIISLADFSTGVKFFIVGLAQKILIANTIAVPVDQIFKLNATDLEFSLAWLGAIGYTLQIYFDFNGYSNMAIGLALIIGIRFPANFNYPYTALSITDFWRKWHITLSTWFRDYVYIPLGGNQKGKIRTFINLSVVFLLCGLWHGASWTFAIWGVYHGLFLIIERTSFSKKLEKFPVEIKHLYVILVVIIGWVIFRSDTLTGAIQMYKAMLGFGESKGLEHHIGLYLQPDVVLAIIFGFIYSTAYPLSIFNKISSNFPLLSKLAPIFFVISLSALFIISLSAISIGSYNPFIYFRF